jgi:hypothetical protein
MMTILKWIQRNTTLACGLDFSVFGLGPAARYCEHGNKPWVLQNPRNHTFVSRSFFLISVSWVLNCHLITRQIRICIKKRKFDQTTRMLFLKSVSSHLQLCPFPQNIYCYRISIFRTAAAVFWSTYDSAAHVQFFLVIFCGPKNIGFIAFYRFVLLFLKYS